MLFHATSHPLGTLALFVCLASIDGTAAAVVARGGGGRCTRPIPVYTQTITIVQSPPTSAAAAVGKNKSSFSSTTTLIRTRTVTLTLSNSISAGGGPPTPPTEAGGLAKAKGKDNAATTGRKKMKHKHVSKHGKKRPYASNIKEQEGKASTLPPSPSPSSSVAVDSPSPAADKVVPTKVETPPFEAKQKVEVAQGQEAEVPVPDKEKPVPNEEAEAAPSSPPASKPQEAPAPSSLPRPKAQEPPVRPFEAKGAAGPPKEVPDPPTTDPTSSGPVVLPQESEPVPASAPAPPAPKAEAEAEAAPKAESEAGAPPTPEAGQMKSCELSVYSYDTDPAVKPCATVMNEGGACGMTTYFQDLANDPMPRVAVPMAVFDPYGASQNNKLCGKTVTIKAANGVIGKAMMVDRATGASFDLCMDLWTQFGYTAGGGRFQAEYTLDI